MMESFPTSNSYYDWSCDFRNIQTEAVNYMAKIPIKQKSGSSASKKVTRQKENPKTCPVCGVLINNPWNLTVHIRRHNNEKPFKCDKCTASFVIQYELKVHLRSHSKQLLHKCNLCEKRFKTVCGKRLHEDTHGMNEYSCRFCDAMFSKFCERRRHESSHKISELKCSYCFKEFADLEYRRQHEISVHNKPRTKQKPRQKSVKPRVIPVHINRNNNFRCKICSERFARKKDYFNHVQKLHPEQIDSIFKVCNICGKKFTGYYYVYHMKAHQGDMPYSCSLCEYKTAREKDLKTHMRAHSSAKPFACKECGKTFKLSKSLKLHLDTHTGKKDIRCNICEKTFFTQRNLEEHKLKVHFKKLEKCELCGKEVSAKYIKTHIRNEHEKSDDPVICEHCGKLYQNESKLKQHLLTIKNNETKPPKMTLTRLCPYCDEAVSCRLYLLNHCKLKHPSKVYKCIVCTFTNLNINKYRQHLQKHYTDSSFELTFSNIFAKEKKDENLIEECFICGYTSQFESCMALHKHYFVETLPVFSQFKSCISKHENLFGRALSLPVVKKNKKLIKADREMNTVTLNVCCSGESPFKIDVSLKNSDPTLPIKYQSSKLINSRVIYNVEIHNNIDNGPLNDNTLNSCIYPVSKNIELSKGTVPYVNQLPSSIVEYSVGQVSSSNIIRIDHNKDVVTNKEINSKHSVTDILSSEIQTKAESLQNHIVKNEKDIKPNLNFDISDLKDRLQIFNGKKFLSVDDLCYLKEFDLPTIIQYLK